MQGMEWLPYNKTLIADGMVCVPYPQLDDLVRLEQRCRIAIRGIRWMAGKKIPYPDDARLLLKLLGEEVPTEEEGEGEWDECLAEEE